MINKQKYYTGEVSRTEGLEVYKKYSEALNNILKCREEVKNAIKIVQMKKEEVEKENNEKLTTELEDTLSELRIEELGMVKSKIIFELIVDNIKKLHSINEDKSEDKI